MLPLARGCGPEADPYIGPCPTHFDGPHWWVILIACLACIVAIAWCVYMIARKP